MKTILSILIILSLQGCALFNFNKHQEPPPITTEEVQIDSKVLQPCPTLDEEIRLTTFDQALEEYAKLAEKYGACAVLHNGSIKVLKKFGNIK